MKNFRLLFISFLLLNIFSLSSCQKEEIDNRDQYVGTWNFNQLGSLIFYQNGQVVITSPIDQNGTLSITKSANNDLIIDGKTYTVNDNSIIAAPESITETDNVNGVNLVGTNIQNGTLGGNIIVINSSITGTWNNSNGVSGNFSGTTTITLTR